MTPRDDLGNLSPRDVMLAKQSLIDFDMETRALQWSFQLEGPPCLSRDSFAYRYAGFGTHEWVIYYDLIRYLLASALRFCHRGKDATDSSRAFPRILQTRGIADADLAIDGPDSSTNSVLFESLSAPPDLQTLINRLERLKLNWLSEPNSELDGHRPFLIIDNERKRLPEAMGGRSMVIDEDCPVCKMMGDEAERGLGVYFWHLDGGHFDQEFAFSSFRTQEEWQEHQKEMETFDSEFQRKWRDGKADGGGEESGVDSFFDPLAFFPTDFKVEPPES